MNRGIGYRLEQYTVKRPREVLLVEVAIANGSDQIAIFRGFSSSLMQPTAFDPDEPVLPDSAEVISIDRLEGPFNPKIPRYIQKGLSWDEMQSLLAEVGV